MNINLIKTQTYSTLQEVEGTCARCVIDVEGVNLVWRIWNQGAPKRLVLLHGGSGSWTHWLKNIQVLSNSREVCVLDIPGFGDSELPPNAVDADDLAPYVARAISKITNNRPVDLVGFSFGGLLAGFMAAQQPSLLSRLVLVGVPALGLTSKPLPLRGLRPEMTPAEVKEVHRHNLQVMMIKNPALIDEQTLVIQQANIARDRLRRRRIARTAALTDLQLEWRCPVHGIWGQEDALYKNQLEEVKKRLSGCNLKSFDVIADAGHWVQYEQPELFNACVNKILEGRE